MNASEIVLQGDSQIPERKGIWSALTLLIPLLSVSPLLVFQVAYMWGSWERLYFPSVVLFLIALCIFRTRQNGPTELATRRWFSVALFFLAFLVYVAAVWQFSPWLAHIASIVVFFAWALGRYGQSAWGGVLGWVGCLSTTLVLPLNWEAGFPQLLRTVATWCCSKALDGMGVAHLWVGNIFEVRGLTVYVDEICGGWSSVFLLAAITSMLLILQHRGMFVAFWAMLAVPIWMILIFFLRLMAVVYAQESWQRNLASGNDFVVLDIATFLFAVFCSWLLIRTMSILFEPVPVGDAEFGPLFASMNQLLCWPQPDPYDEVPPDDPDDRKHFEKMKEERAEALANMKRVDWWKNSAIRWTVILTSLLFLAAGVAPALVIARGAATPRFSPPELTEEQVSVLAGTTLPEKLNDWQLLLDERGPLFVKDYDGNASLSWQYRDGAQLLLAKADFAFTGWNDPAALFVRRGWVVSDSSIGALETASGEVWPHYEAELENDLGGRVYLLASFVDTSRKPFTRVEGIDDDVLAGTQERQTIMTLLQSGERTAERTTIQISLVFESGEPLTRASLATLREHFEAIRNAFVGIGKSDGTDQTLDRERAGDSPRSVSEGGAEIPNSGNGKSEDDGQTRPSVENE